MNAVAKTKKEAAPKAAAPSTPEAVVAAAEAAPIKKAKRQVVNGIVNINISYNNTLVAIADLQGNVISFSSSGLLGFRGSKKSTPYAANLVAKDALAKAQRYGLANVRIVVRGVGPARESAIRGVAGSGLNVTSLMDCTPVPHNGVKSPKPRRV
jgi:small subunit ribosomal protein S11